MQRMSGILALTPSLFFGLATIAYGQLYSEHKLVSSSSSLIQTFVNASDLIDALSRGARFEMAMTNHDGYCYTIGMTIAGQSIEGLFDTGSQELVVFQKEGCSGCGAAAGLTCEEPACTRHGDGGIISYGSGDVWVNNVGADVSVGQLTASNLPIALVYKTEIKILEAGWYQAIIGAGLTGTLAKGLGAQSFSVCLPETAAGKLVWNDHIGGGFSTPVMRGKFYWASDVSGPKLEGSLGSVSLSGEAGILDTGSTLLSMPKSTIEAISNHLVDVRAACNREETLPDLKFKFGGVSYELPPSAYIGIEDGECVVAITESEKTGGHWILGAPFFSSYYTNFNVGGSVRTAPATGGCTPGRRMNGSTSRPKLRTVDPRRVILPKGVRFYSRDGPANSRGKGGFGVISAPP